MINLLGSAADVQELIGKILKELLRLLKNKNEVSNCDLLSGLTGDLLFLFKLNEFDAKATDENLFSLKLYFLQEQLSVYVNHNS